LWLGEERTGRPISWTARVSVHREEVLRTQKGKETELKKNTREKKMGGRLAGKGKGQRISHRDCHALKI